MRQRRAPAAEPAPEQVADAPRARTAAVPLPSTPEQGPRRPEIVRLLQRAGNAAVAAHLAAQTAPRADAPVGAERGDTVSGATVSGDTVSGLAVQRVRPGAGVRPANISTELARARWRLKARRLVTFRAWKRGYEAQHIIPFAVAQRLRMPMRFINAAWNGMMLPSGRRNAARAVYKVLGKFTTLPRHILRGLAHPAYNRAVEALAIAVLQHNNLTVWTEQWMRRLANYLRGATKRMGGTQAIDQIAGLDHTQV